MSQTAFAGPMERTEEVLERLARLHSDADRVVDRADVLDAWDGNAGDVVDRFRTLADRESLTA